VRLSCRSGHTLTLIAAPEAERLDEKRIETLRTALIGGGARLGQTEWLAPGQACDISLESLPAAPLDKMLRELLQGARIDVGLQPAADRRKRVLVADMESTIIAQELLDELGRLAGIGDRIALHTARAMRGEIDFARSLRDRVALLADFAGELLDRVATRITLNPGARTLVQTMRAHGAYTVLVSGGFDVFASVVATACGFDEYRANRLEIAGGRLTGRVEEPILDGNGKRQVLEDVSRRRRVPVAAVAAIGDGANDIPMLRAAGLGVAFHGKPAVAAAAQFRLDHADLTGLLYLQGYRREEFRE
jgi:phosphoserine phosphatase